MRARPPSRPSSPSSAYLEVLHGGLLTTVQDAGRPGFMAAGLAPGGAMDRFLLACANRLVGNPPGAAALEFTLDGPVLAVHGDVVMAVVAYAAHWYVGGPELPLPLWESVLVRDGGVIVVGAVTAGVRGYLAVAGGIDVPGVLGSRSTHLRARLGGLGGRPLARGDRLPVGPPPAPDEALVGRCIPPELRPHQRSAPLRVMLGPEADRFTRRGLRTFFSAAYRATPLSDRMGLRLQGPPVEAASGYDLLSEPLAEGTVQITSDGQPVVLLAERQTTGGYLRIATIIRADLDAAGQVRPGQMVRFLPVTEEQARAAWQLRRRRMEAIEAALAASTAARDAAGDAAGDAARDAGRGPGPRRFLVSTAGRVYYVEQEGAGGA